MNSKEVTKTHLPFLDLFRSIAAFLVVLEHARNYLWKDYGELTAPSVLIKGLYFVSQLGHEAVMIFFVLSGMVVGRCVVDACERGRWSWREYMFARLSRLWVVLIPAIIATLIIDRISILSAPFGSFVHVGGFAHIQQVPLEEHLSIPVLLGNIFFLQGILVPTFGSNGPLWSLSYEFWYYVIFPLIWVAFYRRQAWLGQIICLLLTAIILLFVGRGIALHFPIWLLGVSAHLARNYANKLPRTGVLVGVCFAGMCTVALMGASRLGIFTTLNLVLPGEFIMSACFAALVCLAIQFEEPQWLAKISAFLASFSYTLYLVHLPVLTILVVPFIAGNHDRMIPSAMAWCTLAAAITTCYVVAIVFYFLFERRTGTVRLWFRSFGKRRAKESSNRTEVCSVNIAAVPELSRPDSDVLSSRDH